jgi:hypothetical protein
MSIEEYARTLERAVAASQEVLARYIEPGAGISDRQALEQLLEILDHRELVAAMDARAAGGPASRKKLTLHVV